MRDVRVGERSVRVGWKEGGMSEGEDDQNVTAEANEWGSGVFTHT